jgi:hypothetical protein
MGNILPKMKTFTSLRKPHEYHGKSGVDLVQMHAIKMKKLWYHELRACFFENHLQEAER